MMKSLCLEVVSSIWRPRLLSAIGNRYSNKMNHVCVTKFQRTFGATLAALARGFSDRHFEREGPGDEVGGECLCTEVGVEGAGRGRKRGKLC